MEPMIGNTAFASRYLMGIWLGAIMIVVGMSGSIGDVWGLRRSRLGSGIVRSVGRIWESRGVQRVWFGRALSGLVLLALMIGDRFYGVIWVHFEFMVGWLGRDSVLFIS